MKKLLAPLGLVVLAAAAPIFAQDPAPAGANAPAPAPAAAAGPAAPAPNRQGSVGPASSPAGQYIDKQLGSLGLTPEQQTKVAAMRQGFETSTASLRGELRGKFGELRKLRTTKGTDPALIEARRAEVTALQEKLRGEIEKLNDQIVTVLDPAQREKFDQLRAALREGAPANGPHPPPHPAPAPPAGGGASHV